MLIIETIRNEMLQVVIVICIFILLLLTSCAGRDVRPEAVLAQHATETKTDRLNTEITRKSMVFQKTSSVADYKIGPEDLLEITVFQAKELDTVARVSASGFIKLPLIDKVEASGRTTSELESVLTEKFKTFLSEPVVGVFIRDYRSRQVTVLGSVQKPGVYYVSGNRSLLELLSLAGGLSADAGDICIVQRSSAENPRENQATDNIVIDLDQ